jgi:O-antigen ligase
MQPSNSPAQLDTMALMKFISLATLLLLLIVSPLFLGSNRALFWAVNEGLASIALMTLMFNRRLVFNFDFRDRLPESLLFLIFIAPILWMLFQLIPEMPQFLAHPAWQSLPTGMHTVTIDPYATLHALLWWLAMAAAFVAYGLGNQTARRMLILKVLAFITVAESLFGLANLYLSWNTVGLMDKTAYVGFLTGTFVNRNTAASFLSMGLVVMSCLAITRFLELVKQRRHKGAFYKIIVILTSDLSYHLAGITVISAALLLTGSRAGIACAILALLVVAARSRHRNVLGYSKFRAIVLVLLLLTAVLGALSAMMQRSSDGVESTQLRVLMAQDALAVIAARPFLGHGAGAYQSAEPLTEIGSLPQSYVYNHAHNSYLEAAAAVGIPFTLAWIMIFGALCFWIWKSSREFAGGTFQPCSTAFLAIALSEGVHAIVDFSMQTQANAIFLASILGLAIAESRQIINKAASPARSPSPSTSPTSSKINVKL